MKNLYIPLLLFIVGIQAAYAGIIERSSEGLQTISPCAETAALVSVTCDDDEYDAILQSTENMDDPIWTDDISGSPYYQYIDNSSGIVDPGKYKYEYTIRVSGNFRIKLTEKTNSENVEYSNIVTVKFILPNKTTLPVGGVYGETGTFREIGNLMTLDGCQYNCGRTWWKLQDGQADQYIIPLNELNKPLPGKYCVNYTLDKSYRGYPKLSLDPDTIEITPKPLTIDGLSVADKEYDGNVTAAVNNWGTLLGKVGSDVVSIYQTDVTAAFSNMNVDDGKTITISTLSLTGADAGNYTLTQPSGLTADITPKPLTATDFSIMTKDYDGTDNATVENWGTLDKVSGEDVNIVQTNVTASFSDKNVGNGKMITLSALSLTGADAGNYTLTQPSGLMADITAKTLTATDFAIDNKTYDGGTTATVGNWGTLDKVSSEDVNIEQTGVTATFSDKNAGNAKSVTLSALSLIGADFANYKLTQPLGLTADITKKPIAATGTNPNFDKEYDGTLAATATPSDAYTLNSADIIVGDIVTLNNVFAFDTKNVGTGKPVSATNSTLTGTDANNYELAALSSANGNIMAKALTVSGIAIANKEYDGATTATVGNWGTLNKVTGDDVSINQTGVTASFSDKNVGNGKTATLSTALSLTGADAGNYTLTQPSGLLTADITAKTLTATGFSIINKVYDATAAATVGNWGTLNKVSGEDVNINHTGVTATFSNKNAGNAKTVTLSALSLTGANVDNYTLTQPSGLTADITAKTLTVTANNASVDVGFNPAAFTGTYRITGFVNGEDETELTQRPVVSIASDITSTSIPGTYPNKIPVSGASAQNYNFSYVFGTLTIIDPNPVGIEKVTAEGIKVYPSPLKDKLNISSESSTIESVAVIGISGKVIYLQDVKDNRCTIPASDWAKGVYIVKMKTQSGIYITKVVKE